MYGLSVCNEERINNFIVYEKYIFFVEIHTLDFFTGSREPIQIFLVNRGDVIDCMEVNLTNPQSINIIKEWIGKIQHGCN